MAIGKSKLSDMDFGSFKDTIDKNIETDKASDRFDRQLQAYKEAGVKLDAANNSISMRLWTMQMLLFNISLKLLKNSMPSPSRLNSPLMI